ncbi:MAG: hypothetical protein HPY74_07040 [Firmicutes bacterium]|nr:hypothetical protein [Bacillota bacterium]
MKKCVLLVDEHYVENCRRLGLKVFSWIVDDPVKIRHMLNLGVDAIITNRIDIGLRERNNYVHRILG